VDLDPLQQPTRAVDVPDPDVLELEVEVRAPFDLDLLDLELVVEVGAVSARDAVAEEAAISRPASYSSGSSSWPMEPG
jgi:hypothetical protein